MEEIDSQPVLAAKIRELEALLNDMGGETVCGTRRAGIIADLEKELAELRRKLQVSTTFSVDVCLASGATFLIDGLVPEATLLALRSKVKARIAAESPAPAGSPDPASKAKQIVLLCLGERAFQAGDMDLPLEMLGISNGSGLTAVLQQEPVWAGQIITQTGAHETWLEAIRNRDAAGFSEGLRYAATKFTTDTGAPCSIYTRTSGLCVAAEIGDVKQLRTLLLLQADPNDANLRGCKAFRRTRASTVPALHLAIQAKCPEAVQLLLQFDASPDILRENSAYRDGDGSPRESPAQLAAMLKEHRSLELLVEAGADTSLSFGYEGKTRPPAASLADTRGQEIILRAAGCTAVDVGPCRAKFEPFWHMDSQRWKWPGRCCGDIIPQQGAWLCPGCCAARGYQGQAPAMEEALLVQGLLARTASRLPEEIFHRLDFASALIDARKCYRCAAGGPVSKTEEFEPDMRGGGHGTNVFKCDACGDVAKTYWRDYP